MNRARFLLFSGLAILLSWVAPRGLAQTIKPGTEIKIRLTDKLDSGEAKEGQLFLATLAEPVSLDNKKALARGIRIKGRVTETVSSGRLKRPASITLILTSVDKTQIQTKPLQIDGKSHAVRNTALKQEIVLPPETELDFVVADRAGTVTKIPEQVAERNAERVPESRPAIWRDDSRQERDDPYDALIFSDRDKWLIHSYFQSNYGNLPPGLARRPGDLPPGMEKHLRRDETIPPGLQKRLEPLPAELDRQLPRLPFGYSRVVLSGRVMILADDNQIVDLMLVYR